MNGRWRRIDAGTAAFKFIGGIYGLAEAGGAEGGRTPDLLIANEALSQLSYGPAKVRSPCGRVRVLGIYGARSMKSRIGAEVSPVTVFGACALVCSAPGRYMFLTNFHEQFRSMRALFLVIDLALQLYIWILVAAAVFSWLVAFNVVNVRNSVVGMVGDFLFRITEPALRPIRNVMPDLGGIDISPVILILIIIFIRYCIALYILPNVF